jgi:hypothetical protein
VEGITITALIRQQRLGRDGGNLHRTRPIKAVACDGRFRDEG